ncbi:hypothetical protein EYF80_067703 [Liparis tanakae]|uniref:Uncharacterized protein n=1 Tax=Liparis tanakae TaxID=230148 RepID=A0A4Z2E085_9TELE|nr:hypothetical protein EYF80_067703 [Liparis tanakae]
MERRKLMTCGGAAPRPRSRVSYGEEIKQVKKEKKVTGKRGRWKL